MPDMNNGMRSIPATRWQEEPIKYVWDKTIIEGALTLLIGNGGGGKSLYAQTIAANLSQQGMRTYLLSAEDHYAQIIGPRLKVAKANLSFIFSPPEPAPILPENENYFKSLIQESRPKLVIFDLLQSFTRLKLTHDGNVHRLLDPLIEMAQQLKFGILALGHVTKANTGDVRSPLGSVELGGICRSMLMVEDEFELNDKGRKTTIKTGKRLVRHTKCNYGAMQETQKFRVVSESLNSNNTISAGRIEFL